MKIVLICLYFFLSWHPLKWCNNIKEGRELANKENRYILPNFSGADRTGLCNSMRREIFEGNVFATMADSAHILVNADFPRLKKKQLTPRQKEINNKMANQNHSKGKFPGTVLLTSAGKLLKEWDGYPDLKAEQFSLQIKTIINGNRKSL
jgi:thioredoxin-related protein